MLKRIYKDERYPEYCLYDTSDPPDWEPVVDIPDALWERYQKVLVEFNDVQEEIEKLYDAN